jgi:hypothetical protein
MPPTAAMRKKREAIVIEHTWSLRTATSST